MNLPKLITHKEADKILSKYYAKQDRKETENWTKEELGEFVFVEASSTENGMPYFTFMDNTTRDCYLEGEEEDWGHENPAKNYADLYREIRRVMKEEGME